MHFAQASRLLATAAAETPASVLIPDGAAPLVRPSHKSHIRHRDSSTIIQTGVIVNRSPIITRTPTRFERAYYAYQQRIERALHNPLPKEFYFKPGSLLETIFDKEENARERQAWSTPRVLEKRTKSKEGEEDEEDETGLLPGQEEPPVLAPRITDADRTGDVKSLDRMLQRNLYLLVQEKENGKDVWRFPQSTLDEEELLHEVRSTFHS